MPEQDERVEFLLSLRTKGEKSETALLSAYKSKYGLSDDQYRKDNKCVLSIISEYYQQDIQALCGELSMHLWDLYAKSLKLQDYRECRAIIKQISDLATNETVIPKEAAETW